MVKVYVKDAAEQQAANDAISLLADALDDYGNADQSEYTSEDFDAAGAFIGNLNVVIGTGQLDTALMGEIGKAYKERYEQAKAAGDDATMYKMYGAMFAIKKVMEMVSEPAY